MTEDLKALAAKMLAFAAYKDAVVKEYDRLHRLVEDAYREAGVERQRILMGDGDELGVIVVRKGSTSANVSNMDNAIEWCEFNHPGEIVTRTVTEIRPAYLKLLLDAAKRNGVGVDPATGERLDWIVVTTGEPTVAATASTEAKTKVRELFNPSDLRLELGQ